MQSSNIEEDFSSIYQLHIGHQLAQLFAQLSTGLSFRCVRTIEFENLAKNSNKFKQHFYFFSKLTWRKPVDFCT